MQAIESNGKRTKQTEEERRLAELMGGKRSSFVVNTETNLEGANTVGEPFRGEIDMTLAQSNLLVEFARLNFADEGLINDRGNTLTVPFAKNIPNATETAEKLDNSVNEVQTLTLTNTPTAGSFTVSFQGATSAPIAFDADAAAVKLAVEGMRTVSNTIVAGGPLPATPITVEFVNPPGNIDTMTANNALLTPHEVQTVTITGTPTGGTFLLLLDAIATAPIAFNADAAAVKTAMEGLAAVTTVTTGGGPLPGAAVTVQFDDPGGDVSLMTDDSTGLTGGTTPDAAVTNTTQGANAAAATTTPGVDSTAQIAQTDIQFGQKVITAHKVKQSVRCSTEWATDTTDLAVKLEWLGKSIGGGQLELITPDILADVVDSGITPSAINSAAILGLKSALPQDYLRIRPAWMAHPTIVDEMRTAMASFANSWEPAMQRADGTYSFPTLEGYPVIPNIFSPITGANTIVFGDFRKVHLYFPDGRRPVDEQNLGIPDNILMRNGGPVPEFAILSLFGERYAESSQVLVRAIGRCGAGVSVAGAMLGFNKT